MAVVPRAAAGAKATTSPMLCLDVSVGCSTLNGALGSAGGGRVSAQPGAHEGRGLLGPLPQG